jgi:hypothetical protein
MKTFKDLEFNSFNHGDGVQAKIMFENGLGASVIKSSFSYGGKNGLYEIAVLDTDGELTYDTYVTNDVIGHLTPEQVTKIMEQIQAL